MRELLVDLRAPDDGVQDLHGALDALARPLRDAGVEVVVAVGVTRRIDDETALLVHRAAREVLLHVRDQDDVSLVAVGLIECGEALVLTVEHNRLPRPRRTTANVAPAGLPRRLEALRAQLAERGGTLSIDRAPGGGARFTATLTAR